MTLDTFYPLEDKLAKIKTPNAKTVAKDLPVVCKEDTTVGKILVPMPNVPASVVPRQRSIRQRMVRKIYLNNQREHQTIFSNSLKQDVKDSL